jgi:hypothetical protein
MKTPRPRFQFLHLCICDRFKYSQDRSSILLQGGRSWEYIYINSSQIHECGNWERGRAVSFLGIHKSVLLCSAARSVPLQHPKLFSSSFISFMDLRQWAIWFIGVSGSGRVGGGGSRDSVLCASFLWLQHFCLRVPNDWYREPTELVQHFAYWGSSHQSKGAARSQGAESADPLPPSSTCSEGR